MAYMVPPHGDVSGSQAMLDSSPPGEDSKFCVVLGAQCLSRVVSSVKRRVS